MNVKNSALLMSATHRFAESERLVESQTVDKFRINLEDIASSKQQSDVESVQFDASSFLHKYHRNLFRILFERITGHKMDQTEIEGISLGDNGFAVGAREQQSGATRFLQGMEVHQVSWQREYERTESEKMSFSVQGEIQFDDGSRQSVDFSMQMARSESYKESLSTVSQLVFKDPLVISFSGPVMLTDNRFELDLDLDDSMDSLWELGGDAGWLALDKNHDGIINDGSELFGALSKSGFDDLSVYDVDKNGFIDSSDEVFDNLLIWRKQAGFEQLTSLKDEGVGALSVASAETPFLLKNKENLVQARIRESGIFIRETGEVGLVQQIDMAV